MQSESFRFPRDEVSLAEIFRDARNAAHSPFKAVVRNKRGTRTRVSRPAFFEFPIQRTHRDGNLKGAKQRLRSRLHSPSFSVYLHRCRGPPLMHIAITRSGFVLNGLSGKWSGSLASTSTSSARRKHPTEPRAPLLTPRADFPRLLTCFVFISRLSRVQKPVAVARSHAPQAHACVRARARNLLPQRERMESELYTGALAYPQNVSLLIAKLSLSLCFRPAVSKIHF